MELRPLGRTGVQVSKLCLGTMMFGDWGTKDHDESIRIIHRALDAGINFVDTADVYSQGESEVIVGKALNGRRDDVVLATKFFMPFDDDPNHRGGSRRWIMTAVENSLRRLGTDYIDLYQMHRYDPDGRPRRHPRRAHRPGPRGQGPLHRPHHIPGLSAGRRAIRRPRPWPGTVRHRAADVLDPDPQHRERDPAADAAVRHGRPAVQPVVRWLAVRPIPQGSPGRTGIRGPAECPLRPVHRGQSAQARRRRRAGQVGRRGRADADPAGDRVRATPPGDHRPIIGPRTMEHLESQMRPPTWSCPTTSSTASTRSSHPASPSTRSTTAGSTLGYTPPPDAADPDPRGGQGKYEWWLAASASIAWQQYGQRRLLTTRGSTHDQGHRRHRARPDRPGHRPAGRRRQACPAGRPTRGQRRRGGRGAEQRRIRGERRDGRRVLPGGGARARREGHGSGRGHRPDPRGRRLAVAGVARDDPEGRPVRHSARARGIRQRHRRRWRGRRDRVAVRAPPAAADRRAEQGARHDARRGAARPCRSCSPTRSRTRCTPTSSPSAATRCG